MILKTMIAFIFSIALSAFQITSIFKLYAQEVSLGSIHKNEQINHQVGVSEKINHTIESESLSFYNESGTKVSIEEISGLNKRVLLSLAYFSCHSLCPLTISSLKKNLIGWPYSPIDVIIISINPKDKPIDAKKMRQKLQISKQSNTVNWHFLTGDEESIRNLANQVGMSYFYDKKSRQYAHPNLLITLDQDAKILDYFHGINWQNSEIENSFLNPNHGNRELTAIDRTLSYILTCFKYPSINAALNGPILASVRILGAITVTLLMIVLTKGWWS